MTKKVLAIIPARGGSKGLPRKNILDVAGKPLIGWTIEASFNSDCITATVVSSDDDEILSVSQKFGAEIIKRPCELASDTATSESVILHVLQYLEKEGKKFDYLVLLQPTSPLRNNHDIDNAFKILFDSNATALISVSTTDNKILKAFKKNKNGYIEGISNNEYPFMRRQDLPKTYMPNGAIYIIKTTEFLKYKKLFTPKTVSYNMDKINSLDVDTKEDLEKVENIFKSCATHE